MKTILITIAILNLQHAIHNTMMKQSELPPGFLWEVEINGSEFTMAGSIHAGKDACYPLPKAYLKAYKGSKNMIFEIKEDFETIQQTAFEYAENSRLPEGQSLDSKLSDESLEALATLFKGEEETLKRYYGYEAWLLNMSVMGMTPRLIGYEPQLAVDKYFHDFAVEDGKTIYGLDEITSQFALFEFHAPFEAQVNILENALKMAGMRAASEQPLFDAYFNQDSEAFEKAFLAPMNFDNPQIKAMYDRVFVARNKAWVDTLIALAEKDSDDYFMVLGAGHFFGPDNLLDLLKEQGYNPRAKTK